MVVSLDEHFIMKKLLLASLAFTCTTQMVQAQIFCKPDGNVIVYSNYDGGYLNIEIDEDIPNLKIGITTYEDCEVTISGAYASNVTQVIYAGFQGDNQHCNPSPLETTVNGVDPGLVTVSFYPPVTWNNSNGWDYGIVCNYSCDSANNQGGCNTPDQIVHYYLTEFSGILYYHFTQYGCWSGSYQVSEGGNCCIGEDLVEPLYSLSAEFAISDDSVCVKEGIQFTNTSSSTYPGDLTYEWDFGDGSFDDSENSSHGYGVPGIYEVTLTITDSSGVATDVYSATIYVIDCFPTGISSEPSAGLYLVYHDPSSDELWVRSPNSAQAVSALELVDLSGHKLLMERVDGRLPAVISTSSISAGLYCLRIVNAGGVAVQKVLIE